jgi:hypothetical protein
VRVCVHTYMCACMHVHMCVHACVHSRALKFVFKSLDPSWYLRLGQCAVWWLRGQHLEPHFSTHCLSFSTCKMELIMVSASQGWHELVVPTCVRRLIKQCPNDAGRGEGYVNGRRCIIINGRLCGCFWPCLCRSARSGHSV